MNMSSVTQINQVTDICMSAFRQLGVAVEYNVNEPGYYELEHVRRFVQDRVNDDHNDKDHHVSTKIYNHYDQKHDECLRKGLTESIKQIIESLTLKCGALMQLHNKKFRSDDEFKNSVLKDLRDESYTRNVSVQNKTCRITHDITTHRVFFEASLHHRITVYAVQDDAQTSDNNQTVIKLDANFHYNDGGLSRSLCVLVSEEGNEVMLCKGWKINKPMWDGVQEMVNDDLIERFRVEDIIQRMTVKALLEIMAMQDQNRRGLKNKGEWYFSYTRIVDKDKYVFQLRKGFDTSGNVRLYPTKCSIFDWELKGCTEHITLTNFEKEFEGNFNLSSWLEGEQMEEPADQQLLQTLVNFGLDALYTKLPI
jgi:hypothetical protein